MGLREAVARTASRHAHVLVVEVPGHWRVRALVERRVLARGWILAVSAADADVLAVCGEPGERLSRAVDLVWHQMPGPRVRVDVRAGEDVDAGLDGAAAALLDSAHHREDGRTRPAAADLLEERGSDDEAHTHMAPGGIPLAESGEDRDGLEMDVLHLRLGPVLPHWPAGLVLRCSLQGDVVTGADGEVLDGQDQRQDAGPVLRAARRCDNVVALLALAGWDDAAAQARGVRDDLLTAAGDDRVAERVASRGLVRLHRRVSRSRLLRRSLAGVRPVTEEEAERHGLPAHARGDTYGRLLGMVERARDEAATDPVAERGAGHAEPATLSLDHLTELVTGLDLATARLVVASLDMHALPARHAHQGSADA